MVHSGQQWKQQQEHKKKKKKKEGEKYPRKPYHFLNYDQVILLLKFIDSDDDLISFKSYCETHTEHVGEKDTDKQTRCGNHYQFWKKEGLALHFSLSFRRISNQEARIHTPRCTV